MTSDIGAIVTNKNVIKHTLYGAVALFLLAISPAVLAQKVGPSGNPLPRFVSVSATKAFLRTGPGRQYPVDWVYERRDLPLEIIDEYGAWRQVRDYEGTTGWMLVSLLSGKRTAMIRGRERELYDKPELNALVVIIAQAGVIGEVKACEGLWCELEIAGDAGWVERRHLWGVYPNETID